VKPSTTFEHLLASLISHYSGFVDVRSTEEPVLRTVRASNWELKNTGTLFATMTITTDVHLNSPALPLVSIAKSIQSNEFEYVHGFDIQPGRLLVTIQIDTDEEVSEERLLTHDEVRDATILGRSGGKAIYRLTVKIREDIADVFDSGHEGALMDSIIVTPEGWYEEKLFKDYTALREFQTNCQDNGISLEILSLTFDSASSDDDSPYGLTERQHEALTLALSRGYYERPRQITAEELAEELDISQPSMSDLLRRGERQLLSATLTPQSRLAPPPT
jgi:predicted DNA binding protein